MDVPFMDFELTGKILLDKHWIFAKTMPENPHWYTLRKEWANDGDFVEVVKFIRKYGYIEIFRNRPYTMLNINEYKYWTMGSPLNDTILINRKPHKMPSNYDRIADVYDNLFIDSSSIEENIKVITMLLPISGIILDVGCGSGLLLDYVHPLEYTGIDPSSGMLARLTAKHPQYKSNVIQTRLEDYVNGKYDLIVSLFGSASYIEPYAISWIPLLLGPGGRYFIMFYKDGYNPVTYEKTGVVFDHHNFSDYQLPGKITEFNNYVIVEGKREDLPG